MRLQLWTQWQTKETHEAVAHEDWCAGCGWGDRPRRCGYHRIRVDRQAAHDANLHDCVRGPAVRRQRCAARPEHEVRGPAGDQPGQRWQRPSASSPSSSTSFRRTTRATRRISPTAASQLVGQSNVFGVVGRRSPGRPSPRRPTYGPPHLATVSPSATQPLLATLPTGTTSSASSRTTASRARGRQLRGEEAALARKIYNISDASTRTVQGLAAAFGPQPTTDGATVTNATIPSTTGCGNGGTGNPEYSPSAIKTIVSADRLLWRLLLRPRPAAQRAAQRRATPAS